MSHQEPVALSEPFLSLPLADEAATRRLAEDLAVILKPGDLVLLSGDLGAGKSTLARAMLRACAEDGALEVPSPTFTLVQTYDLPRLSLAHFDLYRLEEPDEILELGLEEMLETGAALIEWPDMALEHIPEPCLWIQLTSPETGAGDSRVAGFASRQAEWQERLARTAKIRQMAARAGFETAHRLHLKGDASVRRFERLKSGSRSAVVMDWAPPTGAAATPEALAYNAKVHRAPDCRAFLAVAGELKRRGYPAPEILACEPEAGLLVLEDFGDETIAPGGEAVPERYLLAAGLLARLHGEDLPATVTLPDGHSHAVPSYSRTALITEAELYCDYYIPWSSGKPCSSDERRTFQELWSDAFDLISAAETNWLLRDYHSPNILWRADQDGLARLGLIDLQDAVIGPTAYDLASLTFDARVDVCAGLEAALKGAYLESRRTLSKHFDTDLFETAYAVMAAQRCIKILGIFVRLAERDGKPDYLTHIPRLVDYMDRILQHPEMDGFKRWFVRHGLFTPGAQ